MTTLGGGLVFPRASGPSGTGRGRIVALVPEYTRVALAP
jgi:hypothetical protein